MTNLNQQMQAKMTVRLDELRKEVIGRMTSTGERIKSRPSLPGDDALEKVNSHLVMKQNDDGATVLGAAIGIPGASELVEATIDVATEMFSNRKAVHERLQDEMDLTPKQARQIRESNENDLKLFQALGEKLTLLDGAIMGGHVVGLPVPNSHTLPTFTEEEALAQGLSVPASDFKKDGEVRKLQPSNEYIAQCASLHANKTMGMNLN